MLAFPDTDELEVHLVHGGKRTIGRAPASAGIEGAVTATIAAVRDSAPVSILGWNGLLSTMRRPATRSSLPSRSGASMRDSVHYGLASGISVIDAAARATLDALNRVLSRVG